MEKITGRLPALQAKVTPVTASVLFVGARSWKKSLTAEVTPTESRLGLKRPARPMHVQICVFPDPPPLNQSPTLMLLGVPLWETVPSLYLTVTSTVLVPPPEVSR